MKARTLLLSGTALTASVAAAHADPVFTPLTLALFAGPIGAVAGPAAIYAGLQIATAVLAIGANVGISLATRQRAPRPQDVKNTTTGEESDGRHVFGRAVASGQLVFGNTAGYEIYRLALHCFEPILAVEEYFASGYGLTVEPNGDVSSPPWTKPGGSYLNIQTKNGDHTTAWDALTIAFPSLWSSEHKALGIAQSLIHGTNPGVGSPKFAKTFQNGFPDITLRGRFGRFLDPRDDTSKWSTNAVLIALHYFRQLPGITDSKIDFTRMGQAADAADAVVATLSGTSVRAQLSGGWAGKLTTDIVLTMLDCAGLALRRTTSGLYYFEFAEDDPANELTIPASAILDIDYSVGPDAAKRPNRCTVKYFSPEQQYTVSQIDLTGAAWASVPSEAAVYGDQAMDIELPFCCNASQAQRIARQLFYMARADVVAVKTNFVGVLAWGRRCITIEIPDVGVDELTPQRIKGVIEGEPVINDESGEVDIVLRVIPTELQTAWNAATDEAAPPPTLSPYEYDAELDTPSAPTEATVVQYPDTSYETRVSFSPVSGATTAEATYITYTGGEADAPASMTEPSLYLAYVATDLSGERADFKVRFFNAAEDGSHYSDVLAVSALAVDNTATSAPTQSVTGTNSDWDVEVTAPSDLNVSYIKVQKDVAGAGYADHQTIQVRPGDVNVSNITDTVSAGQTIKIRSYAYTSNGTASAASTEFTYTEPV